MDGKKERRVGTIGVRIAKGVGVGFLLFVLLMSLGAFLTERGTLREGAIYAYVMVCAVLCGFLGSLLLLGAMRSVLSGTAVGAGVFVLCLIFAVLLDNELQVSLHSLRLAAAMVCGGVLAGLPYRGKRGAKRMRRVRVRR
ncbi:MAG: hypothetical protein IJF15_04535 [Oscillospiraceae bacterium]|nr:hypothetical protein [Oscillospiraceae bacterium]